MHWKDLFLDVLSTCILEYLYEMRGNIFVQPCENRPQHADLPNQVLNLPFTDFLFKFYYNIMTYQVFHNAILHQSNTNPTTSVSFSSPCFQFPIHHSVCLMQAQKKITSYQLVQYKSKWNYLTGLWLVLDEPSVLLIRLTELGRL